MLWDDFINSGSGQGHVPSGQQNQLLPGQLEEKHSSDQDHHHHHHQQQQQQQQQNKKQQHQEYADRFVNPAHVGFGAAHDEGDEDDDEEDEDDEDDGVDSGAGLVRRKNGTRRRGRKSVRRSESYTDDDSYSDDDDDGSDGPKVRISERKLKDMKSKVNKRIGLYKQNVTKLQATKEKLKKENLRLRELVDEFSRDRVEANKDLLRLKAKSGADGGMNKVDAAEQRRRYEQRRELLEGIEQFDAQEEDMDLFTVSMDDGGVIARFKRAVNTLTKRYSPLEKDMRFINSRYGSGISAYFAFFRFLVLNSVFFVVLWGYAFVRQFSRYDENYADSQSALPRWSFFSAWVGGGFWYVFALLMCIGYMVLVSIQKWVREDRSIIVSDMLEDDGVQKRFSVIALNVWDYSIDNKQQVTDLRYAVTQSFLTILEEQDRRHRLESRTRQEKCLLIFRRALGMIINLGILAGSWIAIIAITLNQQALSDYFKENESGLAFFADFAAPLTTTVINALLPLLTLAITHFEQWDDAATTMKHRIWRLYFGKQLNLLINMFAYYSIAQESSFIENIPTTYDKEVFACGEDAAGSGLFSLVMTEFFVTKGVTIAVYYGVELCKSTCAPGMKHDEFRVSEGIINLLYFQSLVWISMPLYPFGSVFSLAFMVINFKFELLTLTRFRTKPTHTWTARDTGTVFTKFYNVTLVIALGSFYYFFNTKWDCINETCTTQPTPDNPNPCARGVFADTDDSVPWSAVSESGQSTRFTVLYSFFTSTVLWMCVAIAILLRYLFQGNLVHAMKLLSEKETAQHWRQVNHLQKEIERKDRVIKITKRGIKDDE